MWISLFMKISAAALLTLGYCFCISFLVVNDFELKRLKNTFFVLLITPVVYYLYKGTLLDHLFTCLVIILAIALIYKQKLFIASYTMAVAYFITMLGSIITGIIGITLFDDDVVGEVTSLFIDYRLNIVRLVTVILLILFFSKFKKMFKVRLAEQKRKLSSLHIINLFAILLIMMISNLVIRYLSVNSAGLSSINNLKELLLISYLLYLVSSFYFMYSMNIHIFNHHKILEIKEYAETDMMTGVLNRQAGLDQLTDRIKFTKETSTELTICFVDINNLKKVNDKYGHNEGDLLIEIVSETIKAGLREFDFVCRLGGDEFLVVFNKCSLKHAQAAWRRIHNSISKLNENPEITFPISVSFGFAEYNPIESLSVKDFIDKADAVMYENKKKYKSLKCKAELIEVES